MNYVFDPSHEARNLAVHGVSLALAEAMFAGPTARAEESVFDPRERREIAFGLVNDRPFVCVYVNDPGEAMRILSLRKANRREVTHYVP